MAYSPLISPAVLKQFKNAGNGLSRRQAAERIMQAIVDYFYREITVYDRARDGELFRVGGGSPRHGIYGVHIHPCEVQWGTWQLKAHRHATAFLTDEDFNRYLGTLLQPLEIGRYRIGFKKS